MIEIKHSMCDKCGSCIEVYPVKILSYVHNLIQIENEENCVFCGNCISLCKQNAIKHEYLNYL